MLKCLEKRDRFILSHFYQFHNYRWYNLFSCRRCGLMWRRCSRTLKRWLIGHIEYISPFLTSWLYENSSGAPTKSWQACQHKNFHGWSGMYISRISHAHPWPWTALIEFDNLNRSLQVFKVRTADDVRNMAGEWKSMAEGKDEFNVSVLFDIFFTRIKLIRSFIEQLKRPPTFPSRYPCRIHLSLLQVEYIICSTLRECGSPVNYRNCMVSKNSLTKNNLAQSRTSSLWNFHCGNNFFQLLVKWDGYHTPSWAYPINIEDDGTVVGFQLAAIFWLINMCSNSKTSMSLPRSLFHFRKPISGSEPSFSIWCVFRYYDLLLFLQ